MFQYNRNLLHLTSEVTPPTPPTPVGGPLCFTADTVGSTVQIKTNVTTHANFQVSTNGTNWRSYVWNSTPQGTYNWTGEIIVLDNIGDRVYFKNQDSITSLVEDGTYKGHEFFMTGSISASGDVTYLLNPNGTTTVGYRAFRGLFSKCSSLVTPPELPATTLGEACYSYMFEYCTGLTTAPELPATTLREECYKQMFWRCSALTTPPELPATILADSCYASMFEGCISLTTPPRLPATTLADACYLRMFDGCTSLTSIPELPATNIPNSAYMQMFVGCSKIKISEAQTGEYQTSYRIPSLGTGTIGNSSLSSMFYKTGGTFKGTPTVNTIYYTSNTIVPVTPLPTPITTPGIYHNANMGLISLSLDGSNWITISDKNLGATVVYNNGDSLTDSNTGNLFQRGNNYSFPASGGVNTDSTAIDASQYSKNNPYINSTYITADPWGTNIDMTMWSGTKGPCPEGFHVPTYDEIFMYNRTSVLGILQRFRLLSRNDGRLGPAYNVRTYLHMPAASNRSYNSQFYSYRIGGYWLSEGKFFKISRSDGYSDHDVTFGNGGLSHGYNIRPIKDIPVQPDVTWDVLYQPS